MGILCFFTVCITILLLFFIHAYRYDREIDAGERSSLKLVYEGDASPANCLVLCVAQIARVSQHHGSSSKLFLELTDGWYSIPCLLDEAENPLVKFVNSGKIRVGGKIVTFGAELSSSQPCSPLEAPSFDEIAKDFCPTDTNSRGGETGTKYPMLSLQANSTRRAKW